MTEPRVIVRGHLLEELFSFSLVVQPLSVLLKDTLQLVKERGCAFELVISLIKRWVNVVSGDTSLSESSWCLVGIVHLLRRMLTTGMMKRFVIVIKKIGPGVNHCRLMNWIKSEPYTISSLSLGDDYHIIWNVSYFLLALQFSTLSGPWVFVIFKVLSTTELLVWVTI